MTIRTFEQFFASRVLVEDLHSIPHIDAQLTQDEPVSGLVFADNLYFVERFGPWLIATWENDKCTFDAADEEGAARFIWERAVADGQFDEAGPYLATPEDIAIFKRAADSGRVWALGYMISSDRVDSELMRDFIKDPRDSVHYRSMAADPQTSESLGDSAMRELETAAGYPRTNTSTGSTPATKAALSALYLERIGYDPFVDEPSLTVEHVFQTLMEWHREGDVALPCDFYVRTTLGEYPIGELQRVASEWYGGQFTALYAFQSSGVPADGLYWEALGCVHRCEDDIEADKLRAIALLDTSFPE